MNFKFNGVIQTLNSEITIKEFLFSLNLDPKGVIVLLNDIILKKEEFNTTIEENFSIEVLNFVCGG